MGNATSHYSSLKTKFLRKSALVKALAKVNNGRWASHVEVHEEATNLVGYHGDTRKDKAEIIIRRKHISSASNDIGFKLAEDGTYQAIISDYDKGTHNGKWMDKLTQTYTEEVIREVATEYGYDMETTKQGDELFVTCTGGMF